MAQHTFTLTIRLAWWLRLYLEGVILVSSLTRLEPDWDKVGRMISRGLRVGP